MIFNISERSHSLNMDLSSDVKCMTTIQSIDTKCRNFIGCYQCEYKSVMLKKLGSDVHYTGISFSWFGFIFLAHIHARTRTFIIINCIDAYIYIYISSASRAVTHLMSEQLTRRARSIEVRVTALLSPFIHYIYMNTKSFHLYSCLFSIYF